MAKVWAKLETIVKAAHYNEYAVTVDGVVIFEGSRIYNELKNYDTYSILHSEGTDPEIIFGIMWRQHILEHGKQYARLVAAFEKEYNPLNNYEMYESEYTGQKYDTHTNTTAQAGGITSDHYENAMDDTGTPGNHKSRDIQTADNQTSTTTQTAAHDKTFTFDRVTPDGYTPETAGGFSAGTEHKITRAGNLGVTTAADMLKKEHDLRGAVAFCGDFVAAFITKYCVLVEGV